MDFDLEMYMLTCMKTIYFLSPSSFCFGVERAINQLNDIIASHPWEKIFCVHALVHNPKVTQDFENKWIVFVESIDDIQEQEAIVVFSAHGTDRAILTQAQKKYKAVYNLECPFVTKIYNEIDAFLAEGIRIFFYIGKEHHQEGRNIITYIRSRDAHIYVFENEKDMPDISADIPFGLLTQTTLNFAYVESLMEKIKKRYPQARLPIPSDVCKATYERQKVITDNLDKFDAFIVIGGRQSNNTRELYEIWLRHGKASFYGESLDDILLAHKDEIEKYPAIAVTGGASTPMEDIRAVFDYFHEQGYEKKVLSL